jgi:CheY-like chemotaxis protein
MRAPSHVLVVDDDHDTREMIERFLEMEGFAVRTAPNGEAALVSLQRDGRPSVILLDLMMPVMNGWQFREAQQRQPQLADIPVVVVSAAGAPSRLPPIEADAWLSKPLDFDRLLDTIGSLSRSRRAGQA